MPALTDPRKERFCQEFHIDKNRIEAVIRTGCWKYEDPNTGWKVELDPTDQTHRNKASVVAARLMLDPEVIIRTNELESMRNVFVAYDATRIRDRVNHILFDFEPEEKPTWKDILLAAEKAAKFDGTLYKADNNQRADAMTKMFNDIFETKDDLPKMGTQDGSNEPDTPGSAQTCG